jgi:hypothetical protein
MKCPSCAKFCSVETQEPEVYDVSWADPELTAITVEVRITRNSGCCYEPCEEHTFSTNRKLPDGLAAEVAAIKKEKPEDDITLGYEDCYLLEEGNRYGASHYGFTLYVLVYHNGEELDSFEVVDKIEADRMEELI